MYIGQSDAPKRTRFVYINLNINIFFSCNLNINIDFNAMKLEQYRQKGKFTFNKLAENLGFSEHSNPARLVQRWCQGSFIPSSINIKKITAATKGKVKANDFF
jgi:hypothetical protein